MFTEEDKTLIKNLGLQDMSEGEQALYLEKFLATLKLRVGMILEDKLSDEQLEKFAEANEAGNEQAEDAWLKQVVPDLDGIIAKEKETLTAEIRQSTADIRSVINEPRT